MGAVPLFATAGPCPTMLAVTGGQTLVGVILVISEVIIVGAGGTPETLTWR